MSTIENNDNDNDNDNNNDIIVLLLIIISSSSIKDAQRLDDDRAPRLPRRLQPHRPDGRIYIYIYIYIYSYTCM